MPKARYIPIYFSLGNAGSLYFRAGDSAELWGILVNPGHIAEKIQYDYSTEETLILFTDSETLCDNFIRFDAFLLD